MQPRTESNVVLPLPEGPISTVSSPPSAIAMRVRYTALLPSQVLLNSTGSSQQTTRGNGASTTSMLTRWAKAAAAEADAADAFRTLHNPPIDADLAAAMRRLRYDEALVLQVVLGQRRRAAAAVPSTPRLPRIGGLLAAFDARLPFELTAGQREVGEILAGDVVLGVFGEVHPTVLATWEIDALAAHPSCDVLRKTELDDWLTRNPRALLFFIGDRPEGLDVTVVVRELATSYGGRLRVGLIDQRDEAALMTRFGVVVMPAVVYMRDGQPAELVENRAVIFRRWRQLAPNQLHERFARQFRHRFFSHGKQSFINRAYLAEKPLNPAVVRPGSSWPAAASARWRS